MDKRLEEITEKLHAQNDLLGKSRNSYLAKEAERKHFEATLIQNAAGKSHAEKTINAQATEEWLAFHKELARKQSVYEFQKLKFEILDKEFWAEYGSAKSEDKIIRRPA